MEEKRKQPNYCKNIFVRCATRSLGRGTFFSIIYLNLVKNILSSKYIVNVVHIKSIINIG